MKTEYCSLLDKLKSEGDITKEETDKLYVFHRYAEDEEPEILVPWYETVLSLLEQKRKGNFASFPVCVPCPGEIYPVYLQCVSLLDERSRTVFCGKMSLVKDQDKRKINVYGINRAKTDREVIFPGCINKTYEITGRCIETVEMRRFSCLTFETFKRNDSAIPWFDEFSRPTYNETHRKDSIFNEFPTGQNVKLAMFEYMLAKNIPFRVAKAFPKDTDKLKDIDRNGCKGLLEGFVQTDSAVLSLPVNKVLEMYEVMQKGPCSGGKMIEKLIEAVSETERYFSCDSYLEPN